MKIQVATLIHLEVSSSDTIDAVKAMIHEEKGTPPDQQLLTFNGTELEDGNKTLANYNIQNLSSLHWVHRNATQIFVKMPKGKRITLQVDLSDTISYVKSKIRDKEGTPLIQQLLTFEGTELEDRKALADYNVHKDSKLYLVLRAGMRVFVRKLTGKRISIQVDSFDTVDKLKAKIEDKEGLPIGQQRLAFVGNPLEDGHTLAHYHILNESTLHLVGRFLGD